MFVMLNLSQAAESHQQTMSYRQTLDIKPQTISNLDSLEKETHLFLYLLHITTNDHFFFHGFLPQKTNIYLIITEFVSLLGCLTLVFCSLFSLCNFVQFFMH